MKIIILVACLSFLLIIPVGCKKYLDVKPVNRLSGNAFFQDKNDVEANVWNTYGKLWDYLASRPFLPWSGDLRGGVSRGSTGPLGSKPEEDPNRRYYLLVPENRLTEFINTESWWRYDLMADWGGLYQAIASANILYYELDRNEFSDLSKDDIKRYQAEAVFVRCLTYLFLIRHWGDVVYYTNAYQEEPLPRMNMVDVANHCIEDLEEAYEDLPWSYGEPAMRGVRANRGAALVLMMNFAMWNAGFDKAREDEYVQKAAGWGEMIINSGAYQLIQFSEFYRIFKGRSVESLFEFGQNFNYGESLGIMTYQDMYSNEHRALSFGYYLASFMRMLYPDNESDARKTAWFDNIFADNGRFNEKKFTTNNLYDRNEAPDVNTIIFRYAGAMLLTAEALARSGKEDKAITLLNNVRRRANATLYSGEGGNDLLENIFRERAKELMGEGFYFYDQVRTGRVMDSKWHYWPLTQDEFDRGGWTWPLYSKALEHNPFMKLNSFWEN